MSSENKIVCPKCGSENKELYMTHGQIIGHRWICKDCGKVFEDQSTIDGHKKASKNLLKIAAILSIILIFLILFMVAFS